MALLSHWRFRSFRMTLGGSLLLVVCVSLFSADSATAQTQLTAKTLLEPIVEEYGPKYQDVDTAIEQLKIRADLRGQGHADDSSSEEPGTCLRQT